MQVVLLIITLEKTKMLAYVKYPTSGFYSEDPSDSVINCTVREGYYLITSLVEDVYIEILHDYKLIMIKNDKYHCEIISQPN